MGRIRIAVTGSRGKSGVVRFIHTALCACGINCRSRITGVVPRELTPWEERPILRASGANVAELRWWLRQIPADTEAVVTENSAVSPELQRVCPEVLRPTLTVLTNTKPDHTELWGEDEECVLRALSGALTGHVLLPASLAERPDMAALAWRKKLTLHPVGPMAEYRGHGAFNIPLALSAAVISGAQRITALSAMEALGPDIADSARLMVGRGELAFGFAINDASSTAEYFESLGWQARHTTLIYNHRADRQDRLRAFRSWIGGSGWKDTVIIGQKPPFFCGTGRYMDMRSVSELAAFIDSAGRCFGCGNTVHGLPLALKLSTEDGTFKL